MPTKVNQVSSDEESSATIPSILLIANFRPDQQFSMLRYAELLRSGLQEAGANVRVWHPPECLVRVVRRKNRAYKWLAYWDKFVFGSLGLMIVQIGWSRVHICDHSNAMYRLVLWFRRVTVTCHDVIAVEAARGLVRDWHTRAGGRCLQQLILAGLKRCHAVLCVSDYTRKHLLALDSVPAERVHKVYNPIDMRLTEAAPDEISPSWRLLRARLGPDYVLHVGSDLPRKNRLGVIEIFCELTRLPGYECCKLLLVGPELSSQQYEVLNAVGLIDRVETCKLPYEADLAAAYRDARCLLFPSYLEGFGWPIVEAQALGCPVFATAAEPMMEVGGEGALYIAPDSPVESAAKIASTDLCRMTDAGLKSVRRFSLHNLTKAVMTR